MRMTWEHARDVTFEGEHEASRARAREDGGDGGEAAPTVVRLRPLRRDAADERAASAPSWVPGGALALATTPVGDLLGADVVCVEHDAPLEAVRALFTERDLGGAPVVDGEGRLVGVITLRDLVRADDEGVAVDVSFRPRRAPRDGRRGARDPLAPGFHLVPSTATAADVMTPFAFVVRREASLAQAAALMAYEGISRVVVVDEVGRPLGAVTALDVARWVSSTFELHPAHAEPARPRALRLTRDRGLVPDATAAREEAPCESGAFRVGGRFLPR